MSRYSVPTATRNAAPSHSPPDTLYAPTLKLARTLGWISLGIGLAEILTAKRVARLTGVHQPQLIQAYGVRELVTGIGILSSNRPTKWMWVRVAGDGLDLMTLAKACALGDKDDRQAATIAGIGIAGIMALDTVAAVSLSAAERMEG